jgi:hypothetical protein
LYAFLISPICSLHKLILYLIQIFNVFLTHVFMVLKMKS